MSISRFAPGRIVRTLAIVMILAALALAGGTWGAARAGTVPSASGTCNTLALVTVARTSPIYYEANLKSVIPFLQINAGQTFFVCTDYTNAAWTAFSVATGANFPIFVPKGVFAGR